MPKPVQQPQPQVKRRARGRGTKSSQSTRRIVHDVVDGAKIKCEPDPPSINFQPWNHNIIAYTFRGSLDLTVNGVRDMLRRQLDPTALGFNPILVGDSGFRAQFRIIRLRAWNLTGKIIALSVDDFLDGNKNTGRDQLCGIVDTGASGTAPSVGYKLPHSHSNYVLRTDDADAEIVILTISCGSSDTIMLYVDLAWRFDGPSKIPSVWTELSQIIDLVEPIGHDVSSIIKLDRSKTISTPQGRADRVLVIRPGEEPSVEERLRKVEDLLMKIKVDDVCKPGCSGAQQVEVHSSPCGSDFDAL